jgi:hypothetical protein
MLVFFTFPTLVSAYQLGLFAKENDIVVDLKKSLKDAVKKIRKII